MYKKTGFYIHVRRDMYIKTVFSIHNGTGEKRRPRRLFLPAWSGTQRVDRDHDENGGQNDIQECHFISLLPPVLSRRPAP